MDITPLANNEIPSPLRGLTYVKEVVPRFVFGLGFAKPEFLLTESFWSGFGWLEIRLDGKLIRVLKSTPIVPLILAFALLSRKNWTLREPFRQVVLLVGSVAVVAALSYASTFDLRNIHGRYLIPAYALVMCGSWMSFFLVSRAPVRLWMLRLGASLVLSLQFHSLTIVLERYFA
jgi:hypothetical protein